MQISATQTAAGAPASGERCAEFAASCAPDTGRGLETKSQKQMGPTLLPTPLLPSRGLLFRRTFQEALGTRFLSPPTGWRFFSPTLASASGLAFQSVLLFRAEALPSGALFFNATETILPSRLLPSSGWFLPQLPPSSFHNQVPGLSSECASRSPQATALASSLHFPHVQSQRPRGQYPLRRLF